ncbi:MAG: YfhO family protein [Oscillospiraceae bacterium]
MSENTLKQNKFVKFFNNNKYILISGLVSLFIIQLVYFCFDLVPFGNITILRMDLYHQYGPLFAELYDRLTSGESLIYSWNSGLGSSFLGNFFNYLSSPLSLIILFFGHKNITEAISVMIMLKAVFSACTFTYYLKKSFGKHDFSTAAFGILYAFCGYFVAYYWNLMWLDAMVFFPLIILGIENIIKKGKPSLYCIALALTFVSNYYMAYMVCIFSVLYFLTFYFSNYEITKTFDNTGKVFSKLKNSLFLKSGFKFAFFSIVAVALAAFALFPLIEILGGSSATAGGAPANFKKYFTVFDFLANHLASTSATIRSSGETVLPNVYCGILTLILVPLYLFSKKITTREKIAHICLLGAIYLSFNINFLNYFWHGFHFPNDLPYRFSFMYSFILLKMAFSALIHIKEFSKKEILSVGVGLVFFIILVEKITSKNITDISLLISIACAVGYVLILTLFKDKRFQTSVVSILLICAVGSEIALANTNNYSMNQEKKNYVSDYDDFKEVKQQLDEYDKGFYRMELTKLRTRMDPCWYDYNGVSIFSSMANEKVANIQKDIGMYGNYINSYTYNPQTPVYNAMFGLKYLVDNNNSNLNPALYEKILSTKDSFIPYKVTYDLPVAFACSSNLTEWKSNGKNDPFERQDEMFGMASGSFNTFEKILLDDIEYNNVMPILDDDLVSGKFSFAKEDDTSNASITLELMPQDTQNVYLYVKSTSIDNVNVSSLNYSTYIRDTNDGYVFDLGERPANEIIYVDIPIKDKEKAGDIEFYAYGLNFNQFTEGYKALEKGKLNITNYDDTLIKGTITADENNIVFTSIPYDSNWNIYIDGKRISNSDIIKISDGLLGFNIKSGEHKVTLLYKSQGLYIGSIVSIITIIICTVITILKKRKWLMFKKNKANKWNELNDTDDFEIVVEDTALISPELNNNEEAIPELIPPDEISITENDKTLSDDSEKNEEPKSNE